MWTAVTPARRIAPRNQTSGYVRRASRPPGRRRCRSCGRRRGQLERVAAHPGQRVLDHRDAVVHGVRHAGELLALGALGGEQARQVLLPASGRSRRSARSRGRRAASRAVVEAHEQQQRVERQRGHRVRRHPHRALRPVAVTIATPVAKCPMTERKRSAARRGSSASSGADCPVCWPHVVPRRLRSGPAPSRARARRLRASVSSLRVASPPGSAPASSPTSRDYEGAQIFSTLLGLLTRSTAAGAHGATIREDAGVSGSSRPQPR